VALKPGSAPDKNLAALNDLLARLRQASPELHPDKAAIVRQWLDQHLEGSLKTSALKLLQRLVAELKRMH